MAYDLDCDESTVKATAGSQAKVVANNSIDANSQARSYIAYIGDPNKTSVRTSMGGEVASFKTKEEALN